MPLINQRAGPLDFSGFDRLIGVLNQMNERRDQQVQKAALSKALESLIPTGPKAAERKAQGLPALGPKKQKFVEAAKMSPEQFLPVILQTLTAKKQTKIKKREELAKESREKTEFDRQLAARTAAQKELITHREEEQRRTSGVKGPSATDLRMKARSQEIGKTLEPFAATMPGVQALLTAGKRLRAGDRTAIPEFQSAAQKAAEELRVRKGALISRDDPFADVPLTPDERTELNLLTPIKDSFISDIYEIGNRMATRAQRGGEGRMGPLRNPQPGQRPSVPRGTPSAPSGEVPEQYPQEQVPDRIDAAIGDLSASGADIERIASAIRAGDKSVLAELHLDPTDAQAFMDRIEGNAIGAMPPDVQETAQMTREMPRTALGSVFGAGAEAGGTLRNMAADLMRRVQLQGGGNLAEAFGMNSSPIDPRQSRAMGEITAQGVQNAIAAPYRAIGNVMAPMGAGIARGGREAARLAPQALGAGGELLAQTAVSPLQALIGYLQNVPALSRSLGQFGQTASSVPEQAVRAGGQTFRALGGMEEQALGGFKRQFPGQPAPSIEDILGLVRPETLPMAPPRPGENIFGRPQSQNGGLTQDEINLILEFLASQGGG